MKKIKLKLNRIKQVGVTALLFVIVFAVANLTAPALQVGDNIENGATEADTASVAQEIQEESSVPVSVPEETQEGDVNSQEPEGEGPVIEDPPPTESGAEEHQEVAETAAASEEENSYGGNKLGEEQEAEQQSEEQQAAEQQAVEQEMSELLSVGVSPFNWFTQPPAGYEDYWAVKAESATELMDILRDTTYPSKVYVYLGCDMEYGDSFTKFKNTRINKNITHLVIDGNQNDVHNRKLDFNKGVGVGDSFHADHTIQLEIKNVVSKSTTFYGIFRSMELSTKNDSTILYENVDFTGLQLTHSNYASVRIKNSEITIAEDLYNKGRQVAHAKEIYLEGTVLIDQQKSNNGLNVFFINKGNLPEGKVVVEKNAKVTILGSNYKGNVAYFVYDGDPWNFIIEKNATLDLSVSRGLSQVRKLKNFSLEEGATFKLYEEKFNDAKNAHIYTSENITIEKNSTLALYSNLDTARRNDDCGPGMEVASGGQILINDPKLVYMTGKAVSEPFAGYNGKSYISIKAQQINLWNSMDGNETRLMDQYTNGTYKHSAGRYVATDANNKPQNSGLLTMAGTWSKSGMSSIALTLQNGKCTQYLDWTFKDTMDNENHGFSFSLGRQTLTLDETKYPATRLSGTTNHNSKLRIIYEDLKSVTQMSENYKYFEESEYSLRLLSGEDQRIKPNSSFTVFSLKDFLVWDLGQKQLPGILELEIDPLSYGSHKLSALHEKIFVQQAEPWKIKITDSRGSAPDFKRWKLSVTLNKYLTSEKDNSHVLKNVVRLRLKQRDGSILETDLDGNNYNKVIPVDIGPDAWEAEQVYSGIPKDKTGVFLEIPTGAAYSENYKGNLVWILTDTP